MDPQWLRESAPFAGAARLRRCVEPWIRACFSTPPMDARREDGRAARPRVLVVDDDEVALRALRILLEEEFELILASDPRDAVRLLNVEQVDAVVTDLRMPHLDGLALLKLMRESEALRFAPCIFMSAGVDGPERVARGSEGSLVDYLPKPLDPDELAQRIHAGLREGARLRASRGGGKPHLTIAR